jgi:hypothetical protein
MDESGTVTQSLPDPQQTSGAPTEEQSLVPEGHLNCLLSRMSLTLNRPNHSSSASGRRGELAGIVWLWRFLGSEFLSVSEAKIQSSNTNISPSSRLIFLIPIGFSFRNFSRTSRPRLTCASSSGKYFMCFGRLWGHAGSANAGVAQSSRMMAGGSDSREGRCISKGLHVASSWIRRSAG